MAVFPWIGVLLVLTPRRPTGSASAHATMVADTCVTCHMGDGANHTFNPSVTACVACHADAKDFNVNGGQEAMAAKLEELKTALTAKGLLDKDGNPVPGTYDEKTAGALWNYEIIVEDASGGIHNPTYAKALMDSALAALK